MECREFENKISGYMDGELSRKEMKAMESHISVCTACRESLEELKSLDSMLVEMEDMLPDEAYWSRFDANLTDRIKHESRKKPWWNFYGLFKRQIQWASAGILILLLVLAPSFRSILFPPPGSVSPQRSAPRKTTAQQSAPAGETGGMAPNAEYDEGISGSGDEKNAPWGRNGYGGNSSSIPQDMDREESPGMEREDYDTIPSLPPALSDDGTYPSRSYDNENSVLDDTLRDGSSAPKMDMDDRSDRFDRKAGISPEISVKPAEKSQPSVPSAWKSEETMEEMGEMEKPGEGSGADGFAVKTGRKVDSTKTYKGAPSTTFGSKPSAPSVSSIPSTSSTSSMVQKKDMTAGAVPPAGRSMVAQPVRRKAKIDKGLEIRNYLAISEAVLIKILQLSDTGEDLETLRGEIAMANLQGSLKEREGLMKKNPVLLRHNLEMQSITDELMSMQPARIKILKTDILNRALIEKTRELENN